MHHHKVKGWKKITAVKWDQEESRHCFPNTQQKRLHTNQNSVRKGEL